MLTQRLAANHPILSAPTDRDCAIAAVSAGEGAGLVRDAAAYLRKPACFELG